MLDANENEAAAFPLFFGDIDNSRFFKGTFTDVEVALEGDTSTRPHAARQGNGRQETAAPGVTIFARGIEADSGQEVEPVPCGRERCAFDEDVRPVEGDSHALGRGWNKHIRHFFAFANPVLK